MRQTGAESVPGGDCWALNVVVAVVVAVEPLGTPGRTPQNGFLTPCGRQNPLSVGLLGVVGAKVLRCGAECDTMQPWTGCLPEDPQSGMKTDRPVARRRADRTKKNAPKAVAGHGASFKPEAAFTRHQWHE